MSKKLLIRILGIFLVAASLVGFLFYLLSTPILILEKEKIEQDKLIWVEIESKDSVYLGDVTSYKIRILYRFRQIKIDRAGLGQINFEPFEVRDWGEREIFLDSKTKVYQREYQIQLIEGKTNQLYNFTSFTLRYRTKGSQDWQEMEVELKPIFISARLPEDLDNLELKPVEGEIRDINIQMVSWLFFGGGTLCILGGLLGLKMIFKRKKKPIIKHRHYLLKICDNLMERLELGEDPQLICHQTFQVLMVSLARKEEIDWLKLELPKLPKKIEKKAKGLFEKCQRGYGPEPLEKEEVKEMISDLQEIVNFWLKRRIKSA